MTINVPILYGQIHIERIGFFVYYITYMNGQGKGD